MKYLGPIGVRYLGVAVQFGLVVILANRLTPAASGTYFALLGLVQTTSLLAGVGAPDGIVRLYPTRVAQGDADGANRALTAVAVISVGSAALVGLVVGWVSGVALHDSLLGALVGVWWFCYGACFALAQVILATGRTTLGATVFYSGINLGIAVVAVPTLLLVPSLDLRGALAAVVGGAVLALCVVIAMVVGHGREVARRFRLADVRGAMHWGLPLVSGRVVQALMVWSPVWVATMVLGAAEGASIGLATRLTAAVGAVIASVRYSMRPRLATLASVDGWTEIERVGRSVATGATGLALLAVVTSAIGGEWAVGLLYGAQYEAVAPLLVLLLVGTVGESVGGPVDEILKMSGNGSYVLASQVVALVVGASLQVLAAYVLGLPGIAAAFALAFGAMYAAQMVFAWRRRGIVIAPSLASLRVRRLTRAVS
ncbi:lipopolysaccharide biosynthesis protein [Cellulomonas humilata]|uniref:O-antigen/teichoic acid export membrane protein n=1 Tax=Cellulomonas humilata TaxID=144055 RepID=A0ABU0EA24_9CELL|nr:hypothetical protein [Cellulomonas humilata]MDQ0372109.1 O-antigen/teichoic acid export membrane protein [Cellulomonas humilata]